MRPPIQIAGIFLTGAAFLTGCGPEGAPTGHVVGCVEFRQKPISVGLVTFHSSASGIAATAKIEAGRFALESPLEVGSYSVYVSPPVPQPRDPNLGPPPPTPLVDIPPKAQDPLTSGIVISVVPGPNEVKVQLVE
jgi:hypothetical protein